MAEELPPVEQEFIADVTRYLEGLQEMIAAGREFIAMTEEERAAVAQLQEAIDDLHGRDIRIGVEIQGADFGDLTPRGVATAITEWGDLSEAELNVARNAMRAYDALNAVDERMVGSAESAMLLGRQAEIAARDWGDLTEEQFAWARGAVQDARAAAQMSEELTGLAPSAERFGASLDYIHQQALEMGRGVEETTGLLGMFLAAADRSAAGADGAGHSFRIWGTGIRVSGYALHWLIAGTMEFVAVAVPALIAFAATAGAAAEGATWMADRIQSIYTATEATSSMLGVTTGNVLGLKSSLQQAQTAADPQVYELLGAAVNGIRAATGNASSGLSNFWQMGNQVLDFIDRFAAKVDLELAGSLGGQLGNALHGAVADLVHFGQILGNLGHIILTVATSMPGLAEVILTLVADFTHLLNVVLQFFSALSIGPVHLLTLALGLEELSRWGGLLLRGLGPLTTALGRFIEWLPIGGEAVSTLGTDIGVLGMSMSDAGAMTTTFTGALKMLFTNPWGWALLGVAALGVLIVALAHVKDSAQQLASTIETQLGKDTLAQALGQGIPALQQLQTAMQHTQQYAYQGSASFRTLGTSVRYTTSDYGTLSRTQQDIANKLANVLTLNTRYAGSNYTLATAIGLASAAGVDLNHAFDAQGHLTATATQQINNLIRGYQDMAQSGTTLANDINAINVQTLEQQTKVQQLNQAWDSFISNVTGGTNSLATLNSDLITLGNITTNATSKIQAFAQGSHGQRLAIDQVAQSLKSFSGTSAQVWQNYNAGVQQAQQVTDWLRTAASEGMITQQQYQGSIKGVVAELLPYAKYSQTATAELSALAQEAGGPATTSYQTLKNWVGNTNTAQNTLNSTVQTATQLMSNLANVAANLSTTLDSTVDNALAQGTVNIKGIADASQKFSKDLQNNGVQSNIVTGDIRTLAGQLHASGLGAQAAAQLVYALTLRLTGNANEAKTAANEVLGLASAWNQIPAHKSTSYDIYQTTHAYTIYSSKGTPYPVKAAATGWLVPGHGHGDTVPAMLEPGEAVVPKHLVPSVTPFLRAHGVPGFAQGTTNVPPSPLQIMYPGGGGGGGQGALHVHLQLDGRELATAVIPDLVGATARYNIRNSGKVTGILRPT